VPGPFGPPLPRPVFYGLAVASVGGPLGLAALFVPSTLAGAASSSGLIVLVGGLLFGFPLLAWYRYASRVASAGGLYSFVQAAAGTWPARLHGAAWVVSYFLYLPSTMAYLLWDVLPVAFPGIGSAKTVLELVLPLAMVAGLVRWRTGMLSVVAGAAVAQVAVVGVLAGWEIDAAPAGASFGLHVPVATGAQFAASVSLLFVCGSLPLYFGAELRRATQVTSRALVISVGLGAACALVAAVSLARFARALGAPVPGWQIATSLGGRAFALVVLLGAVVSVLTLVLLEYVALTRLVHAMAGVRPLHAELGIGAAFVASAALALIGPGAAYTDLLKPSLVALYLSELVVFAVYPLFGPKLRARDIAVAAVASGLMAYGLYNLFRP
jgi:amino acid transporter